MTPTNPFAGITRPQVHPGRSRRRSDAHALALAGVGAPPTAAPDAPPVNLTPPTIAEAAGPILANTVLHANPGTWSGTPTPTLAYAWEIETDGLNGNAYAAPSAGAANGPTLDVSLDPGDWWSPHNHWRVTVTATNRAGSASVTSAPTVHN